jgi:hypothetical protein
MSTIKTEPAYSDVFGKALSLHELKQLAATLPRDAAFVKLAMLRLAFEMPDPNGESLKGLVVNLSAGRIKSALSELIEKGEAHGFSGQAFTAAQALLLMFADTTAPAELRQLDDLTMLLLASSDGITHASGIGSTSADREHAGSFVYALTARGVVGSPRELIVRAWVLYGELWDEYATKRGRPTFRTVFKASCGVEAESFIAFGFLLAQTLVRDSDEKGGRVSPLLNHGRLAASRLSQAEYEQLVSLLALDLRAGRHLAKADWWDTGRWATSDAWLVRMPIVRLDAGDVVASAEYLTMSATDGVFWAALSRLPKRDRDALLADRGHVFEAYVRRTALSGWPSAACLHGDLEIGTKRFEVDCLPIEAGTALVIECSCAVPLEETRDFRKAGLLRLLDEVVVPKVDQVALRLAAMDASCSVTDGQTTLGVEQSWGLVVLLYHAPVFDVLVSDLLAHRVAHRCPMAADYVRRIVVMSVSEFEELAALPSVDEVAKLLASKSVEAPSESVHDFLGATCPSLIADGSKRRLASEYGRVAAAVLSRLVPAESRAS